MRRNQRWFRPAVASLAAAALVSPLVAGTAQANELPMWQSELTKIPSTDYSRDALAYMTEGTEALRPWVDEEGLDASRLEPVLDDVANAYFDGARFKGRAEADVAFDNLTKFESYLKSRMTGASPPNGDAETGHVTALVKSMTGVRLLADASIQDAEATIGPFRSEALPDDFEIPEGMDQAFELLSAAKADLAKTDEMLVKANVEPATINAARAWDNGFGVLETFGITYDGDHDGDGVVDVVELMMGSSPLLSDSDFDGLTDEFEISKLAGWTWPAEPDSDLDGVGDGQEDVDGDGLTNLQEQKLGTSPTNPDTDGDGASDGEEVGNGTNPLVPDQPVQPPLPPDDELPPIESEPTTKDTDGDGLEDVTEVEDWFTDPAHVDTDRDGLSDADEVDMGIDPLSTDTDGDNLSDPYEVLHEEDEGIDPRVFDERMSSWDYAVDFSIGFVAGEFMPRDSIAWLAGNICSGALSFIPVYGWIAGAVTDIRDTIGAAIHGDWVGAGLSLIGVIPYAGDAVSIPGKIVRWIRGTSSIGIAAVNPTRLNQALRLWAKSDAVPEAERAVVIKAVLGALGVSTDALARAGLTDTALVKIARSAVVDLEVLGRAVSHPLHQIGGKAPWIAKTVDPRSSANRNAEFWLADHLVQQGQQAQRGGSAFTFPGQKDRRPDVREVRADGTEVMHEVKLGVITKPEYIQHTLDECRRDKVLKDNKVLGDVVYHFLPTNAGKNVGALEEVFGCLQANGIKYTIHMPDV